MGVFPETNGGPHAAERSPEEIAQWLVKALSRHTGTPPEQIDVRTPFARFGLGSMESVIVAGELEEWLGRELPETVLWDYGSIRKLSAHLGG